jgi:DNA-binding NarL/FixJ family response regulator
MIKRSLHPQRPSAPHILILDDSESVRKEFRRALEEFGYFASAVGTARDARRVLDETWIDLLITDLSLPDADGLDLIRTVRAEFPHISVLVASLFGHGRLRHALYELGVAGVVDKTVAHDTLLVQVCRALARAGF